MTLKDCLSQYCDTKEEVKELERKIDKLENSYKIADVVETSSAIFPFTKKTLTIESTNYKEQRAICQYKDLLKARYERLLEQQIQVEEFINELPTSRLRQIFEYKYLNGYSYIKIAITMNKNRNGNYVTADSLRMEHDRYLGRIEEAKKQIVEY